MPSPSEVANFQQLLASLSAKAVAAVTALWNQYATADPETRWGALQQAYPELMNPYMAASGMVAAEWYHSLDPASSFAVEQAAPVDPNALKANMRWALTLPDPLTGLVGAAERQVFNASRDTLLSNADREGTRWARYASANACAFCRVLATRGEVYSSKESATRVVGRGADVTQADVEAVAAGKSRRNNGQFLAMGRKPRGTRNIGDKFHDNCHCLPVPVRTGDVYTPPDYVQQWSKDYEEAFAAVPDGTPYQDNNVLNAVVNHMRRNTSAP